jgi:tRNA (cytidine/uridine-2'-O-)-methyltransferase
MHIVFVEPEIPQNTGSTARLCAATGTPLHLVGKLGFRIDAAAVKRAGLDYWPHVTVLRHENFEALREAAGPGARFWFFTKRAGKNYTQVEYRPDDYLVFGAETRGLPDSLTAAFPEQCVRIPIDDTAVRSLNLATSAGIALYEALRQNDYPGIPEK